MAKFSQPLLYSSIISNLKVFLIALEQLFGQFTYFNIENVDT